MISNIIPKLFNNSNLLQFRQEQLAIFTQKGKPTKKVEEWKYTSLFNLDLENIVLSTKLEKPENNLNGKFYILLSDEIEFNLPKGVTLTKLDAKNYLLLNKDKNPESIQALNMSLAQYGFILNINEDIKEPIYIYEGINNNIAFFYNEININAKAQIVHICNKSKSAIQTTNVNVKNDAHYQFIATANSDAFNINFLNINQLDDTNMQCDFFLQGSGTNRLTHNHFLNKNSKCEIHNLSFGKGNSHHDFHSTINHVGSNSSSKEYAKSLVNDSAFCIFKGSVVVDETVENIKSDQLSKNILLSEKSKIVTQPCLLIDQNDIECNHGATTSSLDKEALFFLQARGIGIKEAKKMLITSFIDEKINRSLSKQIQSFLSGKLFDE
jgi:Fe-S cluster assembly protein SufD